MVSRCVVSILRVNMVFFYTEDPIVRCFAHGQSNPTYFVKYGGKNMVLRKKPVCMRSFILFICNTN